MNKKKEFVGNRMLQELDPLVQKRENAEFLPPVRRATEGPSSGRGAINEEG